MLRSKKRGYKVPRCSKCDRPRKGHEGPCGARCTLAPITNNNDDAGWEEVSNISSNSRNIIPSLSEDPLVQELVRQLGELSSNVSSLMAKAESGDSGARASSSDGLPSRSGSGQPATSGTTTCCSSHGSGPPATSGSSTCCSSHGAQEPTVSLTNGARVSKKTIGVAKAGEFVNLLDFMPSGEPSNLIESMIDEKTGHLMFKQKTIKKSIDNFLTWCLAWSGYEELLLENNFLLYKKCVSYRLFIQKQNALYAR